MNWVIWPDMPLVCAVSPLRLARPQITPTRHDARILGMTWDIMGNFGRQRDSPVHAWEMSWKVVAHQRFNEPVTVEDSAMLVPLLSAQQYSWFVLVGISVDRNSIACNRTGLAPELIIAA
jgi:hypothetical protein